ncbi:MAG: DinB family protein [Candidatus Zixiibacteriota bacterium]
MSEVQRIQVQLRRSIEGGAWHGPSLNDVLKGITPIQAVSRPIPEVHSVWEILLHTIVWIDVIRARLGGKPVRDLPQAKDWPPQPSKPSAKAWKAAQSKLAKAYKALSADIGTLNDDCLDRPILKGFSTTYKSLHGVVEHILYHAGQIAILKKSF